MRFQEMVQKRIQKKVCIQSGSFHYPPGILEREVKRVQTLIETRMFYGTAQEKVGAEETLAVRLKDVSHHVVSAEVDPEDPSAIVAVIETLETDEGRRLADLLERGVPVDFGIVGMGTVVESHKWLNHGDLKPVVGDDFLLVQFAWFAGSPAQPRDL